MTSILTNTSAMAALQSLRTINASVVEVQRQVSTGLRVQTASDNAAYWSISTMMRSDNTSIATVGDALGLGAATLDVGYAGLKATADVVGAFQTKFVAAKAPGVDKAKIQQELDQFKQQLVSIAKSASFNSVNWLSTDAPENLWELASLPTSIVSSFTRSADGSVRVGTTQIDLAEISLFNVGGGGALQKDIRALGDIGGFRNVALFNRGTPGGQSWPMSGPFALDDGETITFEITIDESALWPGETHAVSISKSTIASALGTTDGVVRDNDEYVEVLREALRDAGISSRVSVSTTFSNGISFGSGEGTGLPGSSISIGNVEDVTGGDAGGLRSSPLVEWSGGYATDQFAFTTPFQIHRDVAFSFGFRVNDPNPDDLPQVTIDRDLVDATLGTSDGWINSAADLASVLNAVVDGLGLKVSANAGRILFDVDSSLYPNMGWRSALLVSGVTDNIGSVLADFDILEVDITDPTNNLDNYLAGVDSMLQKVIAGAATLGALKTRTEMQAEFARALMDAINRGVGQLVDADMDEASTRLTALQTQQQLAIQALQIANGNANNILRLFQ